MSLLQLVDMDAHLNKTEFDVIFAIPNASFDGLAVLNWESWRPIWERNFGTKEIYRAESMDLVRDSNPTWTDEQISDEAKRQFEEGTRLANVHFNERYSLLGYLLDSIANIVFFYTGLILVLFFKLFYVLKIQNHFQIVENCDINF